MRSVFRVSSLFPRGLHDIPRKTNYYMRNFYPSCQSNRDAHSSSLQRRSPYSSSNRPFSSEKQKTFDSKVKNIQRARAANMHKLYHVQNGDKDYDYDYFRKEISLRLVDRLDDIRRDEGFPLALDFGAGPGHLYRAICMDDAFTSGGGGIGGIRKLVQLDPSKEMLHRDDEIISEILSEEEMNRCSSYKLQFDFESEEEKKLPFPDGTFDIVLNSVSTLHNTNDLPKLFREFNRVLKPDGCLMFAMIGGTSLPELQSAFVLADLERNGGVSPHVGPFIDFPSIGSLLTESGFALPTIDIDTVSLSYPNAMVLMEHLQRMGENNACVNRKERVGKDTFIAMSALYQEMYKLPSDNSDEEDQEAVEASVQVIYAIGWKPHESQQKPLTRGSATHKVGQDVTIDQHTSNN